MKLHLRLALPLVALAIVVTLAATGGTMLLVHRVSAAGLDQQGRQLARIAANALRQQWQELGRIATVLAVQDGPVAARERTWSHAPLDGALIVERTTARVISHRGIRPEAEDLRRLVAGPAHPSDPPILRTSVGPLLVGIASGRNRSHAALAGQILGASFAEELKRLVEADVELALDGRVMARTAGTPAHDSHAVSTGLRTPGGGVMTLTMHVPAARVYAARSSALVLTGLGGVLLLAAAAGFYFYAMRQVTRPIRELIAATDRVATGDIGAPLPIDAPAELGELLRRFGAMGDRLKEAQARLIHSAKLSSVGQMVAGISHELNNPLLGMLGHAEYLLEKSRPDDPGREKLETIVREAQRMRRILADLRILTRPGESAEWTTVNLDALVADTMALVRHDAERAGVACASVPGAGSAVVQGSSDQLRQVLLNLVLNALQATPQGGRVSVRTGAIERGGRRDAFVAVADTGPGIPDDLRAQVVEPFFTTKPGRMGLGLAICQDLVGRHRGRLRIEGEPGRGTTVTVELPAGTGP